ncbi:MAG: DNA-binding response regulator [Chloroflexi bacterium]|nr:MAG: DNA-binding response regulator [Chloroflexota bacterium]
MTSVLIVAAYPSVRAGLRAMLVNEDDLRVLEATAGAWDESETDEQPDVLLVDLDPGRGDQTERLAELYPDAALVVLHDRPEDYRHLEAEAGNPHAALLKDAGPREIIAAVRAAAAGLFSFDPAIAAQLVTRPGSYSRTPTDAEDHLTERETQVLQLLALGLPNKTIASELGISEHTAKFHVGSIMTKLGAASRTEAVALAARRGLLVL